MPKRKNVNPILSDSEADEAEEDDDCDSETGLEENVAQLMGQRGKSNTKPRVKEREGGGGRENHGLVGFDHLIDM